MPGPGASCRELSSLSDEDPLATRNGLRLPAIIPPALLAPFASVVVHAAGKADPVLGKTYQLTVRCILDSDVEMTLIYIISKWQQVLKPSSTEMHNANRIELGLQTSPSCRHVLASILFLSLGCAVNGQHYAITHLGTLGGTNCLAYGINNHEQIVGTSQTATGDHHAYMFQGGHMTDLGTMGGGNSWAYAINDHGWLVGASELGISNSHAFLCTNALAGAPMMDLGTMGGSSSSACMINTHGDVVGWADMTNGDRHAFFMTNGVPFHMMDLGAAGGTDSAAYCINSNRMVVGYATMPDGTIRPTMSTNAMSGSSSMMTMGMGGMGTSGGRSWFVNDMGTTAGEAQMPGGNHHGVVSGPSGMMGRVTVDLGTMGGTNSTAYCFNNGGTVVGTTQMTNGAMHAFVLTNAFGAMVTMMDLNRLIPTNCGWELMEARSINHAGQIVGWGMHAGCTNAFLLTPVAGPVSIMVGPVPQVAGAGSAITFTLNMSAAEPLTYQWMHDGTTIPGATNAALHLAGMSPGFAGRYTVLVRNGVGTVASASAGLCMFDIAFTNGSPRLMVAAPTGTHFRIERTDVLGPAADWQNMTNFTVVGSMTQIDDPSLAGSRARFYRALMLP